MNKRKSNMELLRIVLMLGIIFGHGFRWGGVQDNLIYPSFLYCSIKALDTIALLSVNCYVILSGYFLINTDFKISRIFKLWLQILFYSTTLYYIISFAKLSKFSLEAMVRSIVPVISNQYWFATNYVALYFLFPFINIVIRKLDKRQFQVMLVIELFLFSLVSMLPGVPGFNSLGGNSLIWFVVLYTIGGYLRRNPCDASERKLILQFTITIILMVVLSELVMDASQKLTGVRQAGSRITGYTSIFSVYAATTFLRIFEKIGIKGKIGILINKIASFSFGVYLIHEHPSVRHVLWETIGLGRYTDQWWLPIVMIIESISVFIGCCLIDYLRQLIFGVIPKRFWLYADDKLNSIVKSKM